MDRTMVLVKWVDQVRAILLAALEERLTLEAPSCLDKISEESRTWKITTRAEKSFANGWHSQRTIDKRKNRPWYSLRRQRSKASFIAVGAIRIINFAAIHTRKFWAGSRLASEGRDRAAQPANLSNDDAARDTVPQRLQPM